MVPMVPIHGLLFIIYNIYVLWDGLKPPATEWHGMTWRWNAEYQNNSWHWTPRFRPLTNHIALVVYLPASATPCRTTLQHFGRNKHK